MAQIFRQLVDVRWSVFMLKRAKNVSEDILLEVSMFVIIIFTVTYDFINLLLFVN